MPRLDGRVAVVTGAGRGIGAAIARRLGRDGACVVVNYAASAGPANDVVADIKAAGGGAAAVQADVSRPSASTALIDAALERFGGLDILVNNAGSFIPQPLGGIDQASVETQLAVNVCGTLFTTQAAVGRMRDGSRIVNVSSGAAHYATPGMSVYAGTKAAIEAMTRSHAQELGPRHITVNVVAAGTTDTEMLSSMPPSAKEALMRRTALGRLGQPEDIADVVAFLASDDARWVTGQILDANGGLI